MTRPGTAFAGLGTTIRRQSTTAQVATAIRDAILSGRIPPGTPLREAALASELEVSRNTIREAARVLEGESLVRYQMNRGIVVSEVTAEDVRDIYAARAPVEMAGLEALLASRPAAIYGELADMVGQLERAFASRDVPRVLECDRRFHWTLVSAAGSPRLSRFHAQLLQEQRLALSLAEHASRQLGRGADDHGLLLEALRGSRAGARAELTRHLRSGADELERLVELLARQDG